jgi:hypothetical protein
LAGRMGKERDAVRIMASQFDADEKTKIFL